MNISISNKDKKELFVSLFHVLKNCTLLVNCIFEEDRLHIQGMDKSHICLYDVNIFSSWFDSYHIDSKKCVSFDTNIFYSILNTKSESQVIFITMEEDNQDTLHIHFVNPSIETKKNDFEKFFKMPLVDYEYEEMAMPTVEYDVEFSLHSKLLADMFNQLNNFGNDITFKCSEETVSITSNSVTGEMRVDISIEDLSSFSIVEGEEFSLNYSLVHLNKMCVTTRLSPEINLFLSNDCPMKISYSLGTDISIVFFMAPKLNENEL